MLALLASPLVAEIGVRALGVRPAPVATSVGNILANESDENLIYSNCASGEKTLTYRAGEEQENVVVMRTNSQRFRGPEVSLEKPAGVTRVVCLGDSHTWGDGVVASETWPAQLQERAGESVQVMNCGVTGYDTLQEALWYERYVEAFDPDVVILAYFANDVAARGLKDETQMVEASIRWTHPRRPGWVMQIRKRSQLVDTVFDSIFRWRKAASQENSWLDCYSNDGAGWVRARQAILRLRDRCEVQGREFRVVLFPFLVPSSGAFISHEAHRVVGEFCASHAIACFDGEASLLRILDPSAPHGLRVSAGDFHANGKAYGAFAAELAPWLASTGLPFDSDLAR